jgi:tetratricopeptide (TPR) repeat protein
MLMQSVESEASMYQSALEAVDNKDKDRARDLFTRLIKVNPSCADYWVWMSSLVPTAKEKTYCLQEALRLDPKNFAARRGLAMQGVLPPDEKKVIPFKQQRRNWLAQFRGPSLLDQLLLTPIWAQVISFTTLFVTVFAVLYVFYTTTPGLGASVKPHLTGFGTPISSLAPGQVLSTNTVTVFEPKITPTFTGATPLADLLRSTYTPTPFYINTPHPKLESYRAAINSMNRQDPEKMLSYIQQAITAEPNSADLYYYEGEAYRLNSDYSNAISAYRQALAINPLFAPAYLGRGRANLAGFPGNWRDAKGDMIRSTDIDPNLTEAYLDIANVTMDRNLDATSAMKYLDQAYKLKPNDPLVHLYYARAYLMLDQPQKSLDEARIANKLDLTLLDAYHAIGQAAMALDKPEEAVQELAFYVIYRSDDSEALTWLGMAYSQLGDQDNALNAFNKAIQIDSNQFDAYLQRSLIYIQQNQPRLARTDLEQALEINKSSYDVNLNLGKVLLSLNESGNAYMKFSTAEGLADTNSQLAKVYYWRAMTLQQMEADKPAYKDVEAKDWTAMLNLPPDAVLPEWAELGRARLQVIKGYAPAQATAVRTPTPTRTLMSIPLGASKTVVGKGTPSPTVTPKP